MPKLTERCLQAEYQVKELSKRLEEIASDKWNLQKMIESKTITNGRLLDKVNEAKRVLTLLREITVNPELIKAIDDWIIEHG